jgi:hypothetical protein
MAGIVLYQAGQLSLGQKFTPSGFGQADQAFGQFNVGALAEERRDAGQVTRRAVSADGSQSRTLGYQEDAAASGARGATEWWDQRLVANEAGEIVSIRRDVLTGSLVVDESFLFPSGSVTSWARFDGLSAERSLLPSVVVLDGSWLASDLQGVSPDRLHAALTAGNDVIQGSNFDDEIAGGKGVNSLYGQSGVDAFFFDAGSGARWYPKKQSNRGLQISPLKPRIKGGRQYLAYDRDVSVVYDFVKGVDTLRLPGNPGSYFYEDVNGHSLVYTSKAKSNLVGVVIGMKGLGVSDFDAF